MAGAAGMTLGSVRAAALTCARADAEALVAEAHARAEQLLEEAREAASAAVSARRTAAEHVAEAEARERLAAAHREAAALVLQARQMLLVQATSAARERLEQSRGDPRWALLMDRLEADARARLAPEPVQVTATPGGGLRARAGAREIDYSLATQLERCLAEMAIETQELWR